MQRIEEIAGFTFEVFERDGARRKGGDCFVSVSSRGYAQLSDRAWKMLGEPTDLILYFERETGCIGLKNGTSEYSYKLAPINRTFSLRAFLSHYGLSAPAKSARYVAEMEDGFLVFGPVGQPTESENAPESSAQTSS